MDNELTLFKTLNLQQFNQVVEVVQVAAFFFVGKYDVVCRELVQHAVYRRV